MIKLAKKHQAGMWDLFNVMGGMDSILKWKENGYAKEDKLHFTNKGYQLIGDLMFAALMKEFTNYQNKNN
jgi:lysophospholipase L1-like esterase